MDCEKQEFSAKALRRRRFLAGFVFFIFVAFLVVNIAALAICDRPPACYAQVTDKKFLGLCALICLRGYSVFNTNIANVSGWYLIPISDYSTFVVGSTYFFG